MTEKRGLTAEQVDAVRSRTGIDNRALDIEGVVGVGTGRGDGDHRIDIMCADEPSVSRAREVLGDNIDGVMIHYEVTGTVHAQ